MNVMSQEARIIVSESPIGSLDIRSNFGWISDISRVPGCAKASIKCVSLLRSDSLDQLLLKPVGERLSDWLKCRR